MFILVGFIIGSLFGVVLMCAIAINNRTEREELKMLTEWEHEKVEDLIRGMTDDELDLAWAVARDEIVRRRECKED